MIKNETEIYSVVSFLVSSDGWQQARDITGYSAAEKFARDQYRRFNVYKVKVYDSTGSVVLEVI